MEQNTGAVYRIQLLGSFHVRQQGCLEDRQQDRTITRFATHKSAALLAYFAFHRSAQHPREVLGELLWPGSDRAAARDRLSTALSSLRRQLESPASGGVPAGSVIVADGFSVGLNPQAVTTDVAEFEAAIDAASKACSAAERAQILERAVTLYAGPLLPGFYEEWITGEQERLSGLFFEPSVCSSPS